MRVELVAALVPFDLLRWALAPQQRQPPHVSSLQLQVGRRQSQPADAPPRRSLVLTYEPRCVGQSQLTDAALLQPVARTAASRSHPLPPSATCCTPTAAAPMPWRLIRRQQLPGARASSPAGPVAFIGDGHSGRCKSAAFTATDAGARQPPHVSSLQLQVGRRQSQPDLRTYCQCALAALHSRPADVLPMQMQVRCIHCHRRRCRAAAARELTAGASGSTSEPARPSRTHCRVGRRWLPCTCDLRTYCQCRCKSAAFTATFECRSHRT